MAKSKKVTPFPAPGNVVQIPEDITGDCRNAVITRGRCMEPTILDGALVGFDPEDKVIIVGELYIFSVKGANPPWQVKRVNHYVPLKKTKHGTYPAYIVLGTDNPEYLNMIHNEGPNWDVQVIGRVKWICNPGDQYYPTSISVNPTNGGD